MRTLEETQEWNHNFHLGGSNYYLEDSEDVAMGDVLVGPGDCVQIEAGAFIRAGGWTWTPSGWLRQFRYFAGVVREVEGVAVAPRPVVVCVFTHTDDYGDAAGDGQYATTRTVHIYT